MNQQHPTNLPACGLCWLEVPHDAEAHHQARAARSAHCRALISDYQERMRLVGRWQPLVRTMDANALDTVGSWLIDEAADLAWSTDEAARWLNRQLQRMIADEQERRADRAGAARSAAA
jgi:hypothetical protein